MFNIKLALRYLRGRKLRTTLTLIAIVFGVMIIVGFNAILPAISQAIQGNLSAMADEVDLTVSSETRGPFATAVADQVRQVPGVAAVSPQLVRPMALPTSQALTGKDGTAVTLLIVRGVDPTTVTEVEQISLADGRLLTTADQNAILIANSLAQNTGLGVGDRLTLPAATGVMDFEIVGITSGRPLQGSEEVFIPLATAQTVFNFPGQINTIEARFAANSNADAVRTAVLEALGDSYKVGGTTSGSEFAAAMEAANYIYNMFGVIAIALGGFIIFITFRTVVVERRRDIGMLRAIGASRKTILGLILAEALILGVIGTVVGIALGYLMATGLLTGMQSILEDFMRTSVGSPTLEPWVFVLAIGLGLGITLLAGLFPALAAMRVSPLEALRPSLAEVERRRAGRGAMVGAVLIVIAFLTLLPGTAGLAALGILLLIAGLALVLPALIYPLARIFGRLLTIIFAREGQIAQGNLTRQPGRAAITASTITIGLSLLVAMGSLILSMQGGLMDWVNTTLGSDYLFMPPSLVLGGGNIGANEQMAADIAALPGVEQVTTLRLATSQIDGTDLQVIGIDPVTYPQIAGLIFSKGDEKTVYEALGNGRAIIVNGIFAAQNAVTVGDTLTLQTPNGAQTYQVVAVGGDFLNFKLATGYISQANLAQDFNETTDMLVMVDRAANADAAQVAAGLQQIAAGYPAFTFYSLAEWQTQMERTLAAFNGMYVLLIILAIPSLIALINTLAINVLERTREIGTLRAVGATRRQVRRMITAESLLLAATGTLFGLLAGLWLSYILVGAMSMVGLILPFSFSYAGILLAIAVGLGFGILGALIPARQAAKLDIVRALAYE